MKQSVMQIGIATIIVLDKESYEMSLCRRNVSWRRIPQVAGEVGGPDQQRVS